MKQFFASNRILYGNTTDFFPIAPFFHLKKHNYFIVYFGVHKHFCGCSLGDKDFLLGLLLENIQILDIEIETYH